MSFWSFLAFFCNGVELERHLLCKPHKNSKEKLVKCATKVACLQGFSPTGFLHKVVTTTKGPIDHMQISAPFFSAAAAILKEVSLGPNLIQTNRLLLHGCVSEFWLHWKVLQELGDSRLSFLRCMAESIDSYGAEQEEEDFHKKFSLAFSLGQAEVTQRRGNAGRPAGAGSMPNGAI